MKQFSKLAMGALLASCAAATASAVPSPIPSASELPVFDRFDEQIPVPSYDNRIIYRYTPSISGLMTVYQDGPNEDASGDSFICEQYDPSDYTAMYALFRNNETAEYTIGKGYACEYRLSGGKTYYISLPHYEFDASTSVQFEWTPDENSGESAIIRVDPAPGLVYDYTTYLEVIINADSGISSFGSATFSYGDESMELTTDYIGLNGAPGNEFLQVKLSSYGLDNLAARAADAGAESFTLTIEDVRAGGVPVSLNLTGNEAVIVDNGTVTLTYRLEKAPQYLASQSVWPATFYSFWPAGSENGKAVLVFDSPIASVDNVEVALGRVVPAGTGEQTFPTFQLTPTISGNTVEIDFTGVERMGQTTTVTVMVQSVKGEGGMPVNFGEYGVALFEYLPYSASSFSAVETINAQRGESVVYNLQGQRVRATVLPAGIYIVDGRKVVVK